MRDRPGPPRPRARAPEMSAGTEVASGPGCAQDPRVSALRDQESNQERRETQDEAHQPRGLLLLRTPPPLRRGPCPPAQTTWSLGTHSSPAPTHGSLLSLQRPLPPCVGDAPGHDAAPGSWCCQPPWLPSQVLSLLSKQGEFQMWQLPQFTISHCPSVAEKTQTLRHWALSSPGSPAIPLGVESGA